MSDRNRTYIPAEWAEPGEGGGHPKLSGGVTVDSHGNVITARARNRPDQRYLLSAEELSARRLARALVEEPDTVVVAGPTLTIIMRSVSGNVMVLNQYGLECSCPDRDRLDASDHADVRCKHEIIADMRLTDYGGYENLPVGTGFVAQLFGIAPETAAELFNQNILPALKIHNVWVAEQTPEFASAVAALASRYVDEPLPNLEDLGLTS